MPRWKPILLLVLLAFAVHAVFIAFKWQQWGYTGLDLTIYTQAMDQTIHGRPMHLTIHPHNYFGDHVEPILFLLVPFYALAPSPITLLLLQSAALCAGAFAVAALARRRFTNPRAPTWAAVAYLIHPFVLGPASYEFHALSFAVPLLLAMLVAYDRQHWRWFVTGMVISLLVREDVAFAIVGIGLLAAVERRSWRWRIVPIVAGVIWLLVTLKIAGWLNGEGEYKFLQYYAWLGPDFISIIKNVVAHPWIVLKHVFGPTRIIALFGVLLPFAYLPLLSLGTLVAVLPILAQLLLLGIGESSLKIHYTALLTPILVLASLNAVRRILHSQPPSRLVKVRQNLDVALIPLVVILVASSVVIGPAGEMARDWQQRRYELPANTAVARTIHASLPNRLPVVASFRPIQRLAESDQVYSAHYVFMGHRQYSNDLPYPVGEEVKTLILDDRDLLLYQQVYPEIDFPTGFRNLRNFVADRRMILTQHRGHLLVYTTDAARLPAPTLVGANSAIDAAMHLSGVMQPRVKDAALEFSLQFRAQAAMLKDRQLRLKITDEGGLVQEELFALNPLLPTHDWEVGQDYAWTYHPVLARPLLGAATLQVEIIEITGQGGLDGLRRITIVDQKIRVLGQPLTFPIQP